MKSPLIAALSVLFYASIAHADVLKTLYDQSDLVLIGRFTHQEDFEGWMDTSPIPVPDRMQITCRGFTPRLHVISVLKGTPKSGADFRVGLTLVASDKDPHPFTPKSNFDYIIFLEDRLKHEPTSEHKAGGETIYFRNFDYFLCVMELDQAAVVKLKELNKAEHQQ